MNVFPKTLGHSNGVIEMYIISMVIARIKRRMIKFLREYVLPKMSLNSREIK